MAMRLEPGPGLKAAFSVGNLSLTQRQGHLGGERRREKGFLG